MEKVPDQPEQEPQQEDVENKKATGFSWAWSAIKTAVDKVPGTGFLYVMVALVAVAAISVSLFKGRWQYALIGGFLVILFAVPAIVFSNLPKLTGTKGFYTAALTTFWAYLIVSLLAVTAIFSTTIFHYPRSIEEILHIVPVVVKDLPISRIEWSSDTNRSDELKQRPYVLPAVTQYLKFEPSSRSNGVMEVNERIFYSILALTDLQPQPDLFSESYTKIYGSGEIYHWYGSRPESFNGSKIIPAEKSYDVDLVAKSKTIIPLVTGANFEYDVNNPEFKKMERRPYEDYPSPLRENEDFWKYPNQQDYIHHFVMVLDSQEYKLKLIHAHGVRQPNIDLAPSLIRELPMGVKDGSYAISVEWEDLIPGDSVYVVFSREPKVIP